MKKYNQKNNQKVKLNSKGAQKTINRFWGNAARLERVNVRNKNKGKSR